MIVPKIYDAYVASPVLVKDDWFYHSFSPYNLEKYLKKGIISKILGAKNQDTYNVISYKGYNGLFHVSLAKKEPNTLKSAYNKYVYNNWAFIVSSDIDSIKTENLFTEGRATPKIELTNVFWNTIYGINGKRYSCYDDEYHKFWSIKSTSFIGIKVTENSEDFNRHISNILNVLENEESNLPLIDITHGISISSR